MPPEQLRREKQDLIARLEREYAQLKAQWGGDTGYDEWFAHPVNNAQLNSIAAYYDLVPGFRRLLEQNGKDLGKFYEAADRLAHEPKTDRHQWLRTLGSAAARPAFPADGELLSAAAAKPSPPRPLAPGCASR